MELQLIGIFDVSFVTEPAVISLETENRTAVIEVREEQVLRKGEAWWGMEALPAHVATARLKETSWAFELIGFFKQ